jgi:hypothetical protein
LGFLHGNPKSPVFGCFRFYPPAVFLPKIPEWETPELEAVQQLRNGWVLTGDDTLQLALFCRHAGFREAFPGKCQLFD